MTNRNTQLDILNSITDDLDCKTKLDLLNSIKEGRSFEDFIMKHDRFKGMPMGVLKRNRDALGACKDYKAALIKGKIAKEVGDDVGIDASDINTLTRQTKKTQRELAAASIYVPDLPRWSDDVRGVPNGVLRSALFGAIRRGPRPHLDNVRIASLDDISILYSGTRLDQADLDVWEQCLHLAQTQGLGPRISFSSHEMLKSIDRKTGGSDKKWLATVITRLSKAYVQINHGSRVYFGSMIVGGERDDATGLYAIVIHPGIAHLYGENGWTGINRQQRNELKQPMAQWLHAFYSTHDKPFPYKVETLYGLCGSECVSMRHYRQTLKSAIKFVCAVTSWKIWIDDNDLVHVKKKRDSTGTLAG